MKAPFFPIAVAVALCATAGQVDVSTSAWDGNPLAWNFREGERVIDAVGMPDMLVARCERAERVSIKAKLLPVEAARTGWATFGLAFFDDDRNFWHLALVQSPPEADGTPGRRFVELCEMREGKWLAQNRDRLPCAGGGQKKTWEYGVPYLASLEVSPDGIRGEVRDADDGEVFCARYAFRPAGASEAVKAVTRGRPALHVKGEFFSGSFISVEAACSGPRPLPPSAPSFPPYASDAFVAEEGFPATGFFRMAQCAAGRWWAIDPLGRKTVLLGVDHVKYGGHWSLRTGRSRYLENNRAHYRDRSDWETNTLARLKKWGFNMLGGGSDESLAHRGLAHSLSLSMSNGMCLGRIPEELYICPNEHRPCSAFPNVFHPRFREWCDYVARRKCAPNKDDPWLVGYFIDNELAWWGRGDSDTGLFDAVSRLPQRHPARRTLSAFLKERGVSGAASRADKLEFLRLAADTYFSEAAGAIRRHDPNHLVLGARFAGLGRSHPVVWEAAGRYCDAITFNCYPWVDIDRNSVRLSRDAGSQDVASAFAAKFALAGKPMLVTEWSFPALDSGLPCSYGAGQRFLSQAMRAKASMVFARTMLSLPFVVGYDYFMWVDQPPEGLSDAFPEDSNYGLVSERDVPYRDLVSMFERLHHNVAALRLSPPPEIRPSPAKRHLKADEARRAFAGGDASVCSCAADRYVLRNGCGLELEGRIGGRSVFDSVRLNGTELGRFTGMLCDKVRGNPRWRNVARVVSAEWKGKRLSVVGEGGEERARFSFEFSFETAADRPWFLCEITKVSNTGEEPIEVSSLLFRQYADYAADKAGDIALRTAPDVWGAPDADAWFRKSDGAFFGGFTKSPATSRFTYFTSVNGRSQHPDAIFAPDCMRTLAPGETMDLGGAVWMVAICGAEGGKADWKSTVEALEKAVK